MSRSTLAADAGSIALASNDYIIVGVVAVVALAALAVGFVLRKEVLAADAGTPKMQDIGRAVQEGATAYLNRQFKTLAVFVVIVFFLLFALPAANIGESIGRSIPAVAWNRPSIAATTRPAWPSRNSAMWSASRPRARSTAVGIA